MESFREVLSKKLDETHVQNLYNILFVYNFLHGLILGNFSGLLSSIKSEFDLSTGQLGDALSTASIGAAVGLFFIPKLLVEKGSRISAIYASVFFLFTYCMMTIASATSVYLGVFALICMGLGIVWMDSSLNTQAALMETIKGFPLFGRLQGTYSIGAIVGALLSARLVDSGYRVWEILSVATVVYFPAIFLVVYFLLNHDDEILVNQVRELEKDRLETLKANRRLGNYSSNRSSSNLGATSNASNNNSDNVNNNSDEDDSDSDDEAEDREMLSSGGQNSSNNTYGTVNQHPITTTATSNYANLFQWLFAKALPLKADLRTLIILALITFVINFAESSVTYYSELYLETWGVSTFTAVMGFVAFQLGLAISRLLSDWVVFRFGRKHVMVAGNAIAGIGMGLVAAAGITSTTGTLALAIIGFILVGLFEGPMSPVILGFASNLKGFQPADAIPVVTAFGMTGLVIGPLVNGNIVDWINYKATFFIQALFLVIAALLASLTRERYHVKRVKQRLSPPPVSSTQQNQQQQHQQQESSNTMHESEEVR